MIAGILVFFLIGSGIVFARAEKREAMLFVQKKDGQTVKGELLTVRKGILELLLHESADKAYVRLDELRSLRIEKKGHGASPFSGIFLGGGAGAASVSGDSIQIDGLAPEKLKLVEAKLDSRARFRSLPVAEPLIAPLPEPIPATLQVNGHPTLGSPTSAPAERGVTHRWHISVIPGIFYSQGGSKLASVIKKVGFGDRCTYSKSWNFFTGNYDPGGVAEYPTKDPASHFVLKDIRIEYSLTPKLMLGLAYSPLGRKTAYEPFGKHRISGFKYMESIDKFLDDWSDKGVHLYCGFWGNAYFMTAAFVPFPDAINKKTMFKLGAGVGLGSINSRFLEETGDYPKTIVDAREFNRKVPCLTVFMQLDQLIGRHLSLGLNLDFKYVPFHVDAFKLTVPYTFYSTHETVMVAADIPGFNMNIGGFGAGISLGIHY